VFFSKIRLRRDISPRDIFNLTRNNGYDVHKLIWNLFADTPERQRDFLYHYESIDGVPTFYTVSERQPMNAAGMWEIIVKEYHPKLLAGQPLSFTLRVNPIRTKRDEKGRQHRHDVVMEEKGKLKNQGKHINEAEIVQECGAQWLRTRCAGLGFNVNAGGVRADGYRQQKLIKHNGNQLITFSTLDFNGILTVTNPDTFVAECLYKGIGPAKSFGCGLMMVRRV
jgi:CRISPR system Cascade subunit CasE